MSFSQLAFSLHGRMRRRDFWLGQILLAFVVGFIAMILVPAIAQVTGVPSGGLQIPAPVAWGIRLLLFWPALAIAVKRGHDRNRPAAWIVALYAASFAVDLLPAVAEAFRPAVTALQVAFVAYVLVDLGLLDGAKGADRFGPSPKTAAGKAEVFA